MRTSTCRKAQLARDLRSMLLREAKRGGREWREYMALYMAKARAKPQRGVGRASRIYGTRETIEDLLLPPLSVHSFSLSHTVQQLSIVCNVRIASDPFVDV